MMPLPCREPAQKQAQSKRFLRHMENRYQSLFRPGNLALSMVAFAGLTLLAAFLWKIAAGYVLLLLIPALAISFYQMVLSPVYGLRTDAKTLTVLADTGRTTVAFSDIAHVRIDETAEKPGATLVLTNGAEVGIPSDMGSDQFDLIRIATDRGIPVRSA
jgi:hypothetical protein